MKTLILLTALFVSITTSQAQIKHSKVRDRGLQPARSLSPSNTNRSPSTQTPQPSNTNRSPSTQTPQLTPEQQMEEHRASLAAMLKRAKWKQATLIEANTPAGTPQLCVFTVTEVLPEGCIGHITPYGYTLFFMYGLVEKGNIVDGTQLYVEAYPTGSFQYTTILGATNTVRKYQALRWADYRSW